MSLSRLQVDVIDLYQVHWTRPEEDIEEGWDALSALEEEGKVRHIGVSNFDVSQMEPYLLATTTRTPASSVSRSISASAPSSVTKTSTRESGAIFASATTPSLE